MNNPLARGIKALNAVKLASGDYAHYDNGMRKWYVVSEGDVAEYVDYADSDDEQVSGDAYSHWCAGTVSSEASRAELIELGVAEPISIHISDEGTWSEAVIDASGIRVTEHGGCPVERILADVDMVGTLDDIAQRVLTRWMDGYHGDPAKAGLRVTVECRNNQAIAEA